MPSPRRSPSFSVERQRLFVVRDHFVLTAHLVVDAGEVVERFSLAVAVAELAVECLCLREACDRVLPTVLVAVDDGEAVEDLRLGLGVAGFAGGQQRQFVGPDPVVPVASEREEIDERVGQGYDGAPVVRRSARLDRRDQAPPFGFEPRERVRVPGVAGPEHELGCLGALAQPGCGLANNRLAIRGQLGVEALVREEPDQVVEAIAVLRAGGFEHLCFLQTIQQPLHLAPIGRVGPDRQRGGEVRAGQRREQAEQPCLRRREILVADGKGRSHGLVLQLELAEPIALVLQPIGQPRQRVVRVVLQPAAGNPHGERQLTALAHDPQRSLAFGRDSRRADNLAEQLHRDIGVEDFDFARERPRQPAEWAAAGHDQSARRRAR